MSKRYSRSELEPLLKRLIIPIEGKRKVSFATKTDLMFANGYICVQANAFGIFIEFDLSQIYMPVLYFPIQKDSINFFVWRTDCNRIDVLQPRRVIESTGFSPKNFYVNPDGVYTHGMRVLK